MAEGDRGRLVDGQRKVAVALERSARDDAGVVQTAAGRIARIGQTQDTRCLRLIVADTIEQKILRWQEIRLADGAVVQSRQPHGRLPAPGSRVTIVVDDGVRVFDHRAIEG